MSKKQANDYAKERASPHVIKAVLDVHDSRLKAANDYAERRMKGATLSGANQVADREIASKRKELAGWKAARIGSQIINKVLNARTKFRNPIHSSGGRATIVLNQPVITKDESRFFRHSYNQEKEQLFYT